MADKEKNTVKVNEGEGRLLSQRSLIIASTFTQKQEKKGNYRILSFFFLTICNFRISFFNACLLNVFFSLISK